MTTRCDQPGKLHLALWHMGPAEDCLVSIAIPQQQAAHARSLGLNSKALATANKINTSIAPKDEQLTCGLLLQ